MSQDFPSEGALLGIDFGTKRVGIAISTPDQSISSPLETLQRSQPAQESKIFCKICKEYRIKGLVVGLPVHMSGDEGEKAKMARKFGDWLSKISELPVIYWDERFTTSLAQHHLREFGISKAKQKSRLDMLAAQVMLQSFLDAPDRFAAPSAIDN
ncbi:Holliday junction resolvase RuvX [uncultured Rubinisphaera sp.]|uniref:Holliday junction resolvase RuvX n=1 Tax=uncultured Rubinisphaera sp. TaxID=1678686 RepID=UPI0030DB41C9|tara:strand:+ start:10953 stop:11417 length:465 start_codon:yes stop_codon:yes gene_type:complete